MNQLPFDKDSRDASEEICEDLVPSQKASIAVGASGHNAEKSATAHNKSNDKKKINWPAWIQAGCGVLLVGITGFYTYYAKQQVDKTQDAVTEAGKQTGLLKKQLVGTQAAILDFGPQLEVSGLYINLGNNGHVIATDIHVEWDAARTSSPESATEWQIFKADIPQLAAGAAFQRLYTLTGTTPQQLRTIRETTNRETVVVKATWSYDNGFGDKIKNSVCKAYLAFPWVKNEAGGIFRASGWDDCLDYTAAINNLRKAERAEPPQ